MLASKTELATKEKNHQKNLLEASLEVAEKERQKIAFNIHDEIGVNLSVLKINFSKLQQYASKDENVEATIAVSYALIENSMDIIRSITSDIRPKTLLTLGLVAAIRELSREINNSGAADVNFLCLNEIFIPDKNQELQLHRLIKEVLNNTLRHAKPSFIEIKIENKENSLFVIILHNGMGVSTEKIKELALNSKGLGLKSIFTRLAILKGSIDFLIENERQAVVILKCPFL